jgi:thiosulfate/3-mercaptopyruvate sulfurtransferase
VARSPLISAEDLRDLLRGRKQDLVLLDARPNRAAYEAGHLQGAIHADLNSELSAALEPEADPAHGGRHPLPSIETWTRRLGNWGIGPDTHVVIYDDHDSSNAASRAWWMLRAAGHKHLQILDGGFGAALAEPLTVTAAIEPPAAREPYPASAWHLPTADVAQVDRVRHDPQWKVLDVRSEPRFRGETEPIDPIAGHIPGAVNLPFAKNVEHGGHFKPAKALRHQYERLLGDTPPERLIVHCGSGVTACQTLLALHIAGLEGASLYVGSWSEWCRNELPREPAENRG